jgi:hypothetical protein
LAAPDHASAGGLGRRDQAGGLRIVEEDDVGALRQRREVAGAARESLSVEVALTVAEGTAVAAIPVQFVACSISATPPPRMVELTC